MNHNLVLEGERERNENTFIMILAECAREEKKCTIKIKLKMKNDASSSSRNVKALRFVGRGRRETVTAETRVCLQRQNLIHHT